MSMHHSTKWHMKYAKFKRLYYVGKAVAGFKLEKQSRSVHSIIRVQGDFEGAVGSHL